MSAAELAIPQVFLSDFKNGYRTKLLFKGIEAEEFIPKSAIRRIQLKHDKMDRQEAVDRYLKVVIDRLLGQISQQMRVDDTDCD